MIIPLFDDPKFDSIAIVDWYLNPRCTPRNKGFYEVFNKRKLVECPVIAMSCKNTSVHQTRVQKHMQEFSLLLVLLSNHQMVTSCFHIDIVFSTETNLSWSISIGDVIQGSWKKKHTPSHTHMRTWGWDHSSLRSLSCHVNTHQYTKCIM